MTRCGPSSATASPPSPRPSRTRWSATGSSLRSCSAPLPRSPAWAPRNSPTSTRRAASQPPGPLSTTPWNSWYSPDQPSARAEPLRLLAGMRVLAHCCSGRLEGAQPLWFRPPAERRRKADQAARPRRRQVALRPQPLAQLHRPSLFCWQARIFQLVPPTAEVGKWPEALAKLGSDRPFHRIVASAGGGAQALLGQQGDTGKSCGVVGKDVGAVGIGLDQACGCGCRPSCLCEQRSAVGRRARDLLECPVPEQLLDLSLASLPSAHYRTLTCAAASSSVASSGMRTTTKGPD